MGAGTSLYLQRQVLALVGSVIPLQVFVNGLADAADACLVPRGDGDGEGTHLPGVLVAFVTKFLHDAIGGVHVGKGTFHQFAGRLDHAAHGIGPVVHQEGAPRHAGVRSEQQAGQTIGNDGAVHAPVEVVLREGCPVPEAEGIEAEELRVGQADRQSPARPRVRPGVERMRRFSSHCNGRTPQRHPPAVGAIRSRPGGSSRWSTRPSYGRWSATASGCPYTGSCLAAPPDRPAPGGHNR